MPPKSPPIGRSVVFSNDGVEEGCKHRVGLGITSKDPSDPTRRTCAPGKGHTTANDIFKSYA